MLIEDVMPSSCSFGNNVCVPVKIFQVRLAYSKNTGDANCMNHPFGRRHI